MLLTLIIPTAYLQPASSPRGQAIDVATERYATRPERPAGDVLAAYETKNAAPIAAEQADGPARRPRQATEINDQVDVIRARRSHIKGDLASGREIVVTDRLIRDGAAVNEKVDGGARASVLDNDLLPASRASADRRGDERPRSFHFLALLEKRGVAVKASHEREQHGDGRGVVHDGNSKLFDGRTSDGERLAILLLLVAAAGYVCGAGVGMVARNRRDTAGRMIGAALAVLGLVAVALFVVASAG